MKRFKNDRRGMSGKVGALLLILLVIVIFMLATISIPYVGKQNIAVGDTLTYEITSSGSNTKGKLLIIVMDVGSTNLDYNYTYIEDGVAATGSNTVSYNYAGNVLTMNMSYGFFLPIFISPEGLSESASSYWVSLSGLTPILVQKYSETIGTTTITVMVKMGTNLVVSVEYSDGTDNIKMTLKDSSMLWVKI